MLGVDIKPSGSGFVAGCGACSFILETRGAHPRLGDWVIWVQDTGETVRLLHVYIQNRTTGKGVHRGWVLCVPHYAPLFTELVENTREEVALWEQTDLWRDARGGRV